MLPQNLGIFWVIWLSRKSCQKKETLLWSNHLLKYNDKSICLNTIFVSQNFPQILFRIVIILDLMTLDTWHVTPDMWHMACDMWHVIHGRGWTFSQTFSSIAITVWDYYVLKIGRKRTIQSHNQWVTKVFVKQPGYTRSVRKCTRACFINPYEWMKITCWTEHTLAHLFLASCES